MQHSEGESFRKFFRDTILAVVSGFLAEPTLRRINFDISPYLRHIWFVIGLFIGVDAITRGHRSLRKLVLFHASATKTKLTFSYLAVGIISVALGAFYWWGLGKVFSKQEPNQEPFAVKVEMRIISGGAMNTGFYLMQGGQGNCVISPVGTLLYIRITNLKPTNAMITGYIVEDESNGKVTQLTRMDGRAGYLLSAPIKGMAVKPENRHIGGVINFPAGYQGVYSVSFSSANADFQNAIVMEEDSLDRTIGDKYIPSLQSARGWALFATDWPVRHNLRVTLIDDLGVKHPYECPLPPPNVGSAPDVMPHTMTVAGFVDVSTCRR
jgi:hypothetical protein